MGPLGSPQGFQFWGNPRGRPVLEGLSVRHGADHGLLPTNRKGRAMSEPANELRGSPRDESIEQRSLWSAVVLPAAEGIPTGAGAYVGGRMAKHIWETLKGEQPPSPPAVLPEPPSKTEPVPTSEANER